MRLRRAVPNSIAFELTWRCDQQCAYCYNVWKSPEGGYGVGEPLDTASFKALIDRAVRQSGCSSLCITGGEPLLRHDALELIAHAAGLGGPVVLITNGAHVTAAVADQLAALPQVSVQLTLLAADRELHDAIRGRRNFDVAVDALATLRERRVPVTICFVCTRRNFAALPGVLDLAYASGVRELAFNRMAPAGQAARRLDELAPTVEMLEAALEAADDLAPRYGIRVATGIPIPPCLVSPDRHRGVSFATCSTATTRPNFVVDYQGNLRSCNLSPVILGNLCRQSWRRAVNGGAGASYLRRFARALPPVCRPCTLARSCRGGCKEAAHACYGSLEEEEPLLRSRRLEPAALWNARQAAATDNLDER